MTAATHGGGGTASTNGGSGGGGADFHFPPVVHDWVIKGLGMSSRVCVTG